MCASLRFLCLNVINKSSCCFSFVVIFLLWFLFDYYLSKTELTCIYCCHKVSIVKCYHWAIEPSNYHYLVVHSLASHKLFATFSEDTFLSRFSFVISNWATCKWINDVAFVLWRCTKKNVFEISKQMVGNFSAKPTFLVNKNTISNSKYFRATICTGIYLSNKCQQS